MLSWRADGYIVSYMILHTQNTQKERQGEYTYRSGLFLIFSSPFL